MFPLSSQYDKIIHDANWTASCEIVGNSVHPNRDSQRRHLRESLDLATSPLPNVAAWLKEPSQKTKLNTAKLNAIDAIREPIPKRSEETQSHTTKPHAAKSHTPASLQNLWEQLGVPRGQNDNKKRKQPPTLDSIATPTPAPKQQSPTSRLKRRDATPPKAASTITYESALIERLCTQRET